MVYSPFVASFVVELAILNLVCYQANLGCLACALHPNASKKRKDRNCRMHQRSVFVTLHWTQSTCLHRLANVNLPLHINCIYCLQFISTGAGGKEPKESEAANDWNSSLPTSWSHHRHHYWTGILWNLL